jgi:hypothetical protein
VELRQLESSVAVRRLQHRSVCPYALEPYDPVHPATFDRPLALQHESELDEELSRGCEVVNHDADVLDPLDSHVFEGKEPDSVRGARGRAVFSGIAFGWRVPVTPRQEADLGQRAGMSPDRPGRLCRGVVAVVAYPDRQT